MIAIPSLPSAQPASSRSIDAAPASSAQAETQPQEHFDDLLDSTKPAASSAPGPANSSNSTSPAGTATQQVPDANPGAAALASVPGVNTVQILNTSGKGATAKGQGSNSSNRKTGQQPGDSAGTTSDPTAAALAAAQQPVLSTTAHLTGTASGSQVSTGDSPAITEQGSVKYAGASGVLGGSRANPLETNGAASGTLATGVLGGVGHGSASSQGSQGFQAVTAPSSSNPAATAAATIGSVISPAGIAQSLPGSTPAPAQPGSVAAAAATTAAVAAAAAVAEAAPAAAQLAKSSTRNSGGTSRGTAGEAKIAAFSQIESSNSGGKGGAHADSIVKVAEKQGVTSIGTAAAQQSPTMAHKASTQQPAAAPRTSAGGASGSQDAPSQQQTTSAAAAKASTRPQAQESPPAQSAAATSGTGTGAQDITAFAPRTVAPNSAPAAPAQAPAAASTLTQVLETADKMRSDGQSRVEMQVKLDDGQQITVRLQLSQGAIHPIFKTESPELRQAIEQGWTSFRSAASDRGLQIATPVFESSSTGSSFNSFANGGKSGGGQYEDPSQDFATPSFGLPGQNSQAQTATTQTATASSAGGVQLYA